MLESDGCDEFDDVRMVGELEQVMNAISRLMDCVSMAVLVS